ncbi:MAG: PEP-CTERM sorting domain-containing protein [Opitutales bacterium]|nr:PEP-CTERM sorting domain-containing protein [Opitutales bacterium]
MKKLFISSLIIGATAFAFGADNYNIGASWRGSGGVDDWSNGNATFSEDDAIFDYQYYMQATGITTPGNWGVDYWLYSENTSLKPYYSPSSLTFQNLSYEKDGVLTASKLYLTSKATGKTTLTVANDITFKMDASNTSVVFQNTSSTQRFGLISAGGDFNIGTADQAEGVKGTLAIGGSGSNIKELKITGATNVRTGGTLRVFADTYTTGKITLDTASSLIIGDGDTYGNTLTVNGYSSTGTSSAKIYANTVNITDTISLTNTETSTRTTIYADSLSTKDIVASGNGWLYFYAKDVETNTTFNVDGNITLSDNAKIMSQNGTSFGSNNVRADITMSGTSMLSFGFATSEKLSRNVYAGVITLNGVSTDSRPTINLINITARQDSHTTWDIKGLSGTQGNITIYTPGTNNTASLILSIDEGKTYSYSGVIQNLHTIMTGTNSKGVQYLRGNLYNIGTLESRGGTLYINGTHLTGTKIRFNNGSGKLGIVSENSDYGELNAASIELNYRATLLLDISDSVQDIITADGISVSATEVGGALKTFHIDFNLADDIVLDKQYRVFTAKSTLNTNGTSLDLITSTNNLGYDVEFSVADNSLYVIFSTAVPEPAEWAMVFGALALGFAIYRRRK